MKKTDEKSEQFEGWVILELMGHRRLAGFLREQEIGGASFLRLDVPGTTGKKLIATQFYRQSFTNRNSGYGSAIAIVLLIAVIPVMIYNLKKFRDEEAF